MVTMVKEARRVECYRGWVDNVKLYLAHDRLRTFDIKEGREPLCKFLRKPVLTTSFHKENNSNRFQKDFNLTTTKCWTAAACLLLLSVSIGVFIWM